MTDTDDLGRRLENLELRMERTTVAMLKVERDVSNALYASKLAERIVFVLVGAVALGVLGAVLNLVVRQ